MKVMNENNKKLQVNVQFPICRTGPKLSHLMFANDLILFSEASVEQAKVIANVMQKFCNMSGQKINVAKFSLFCSKNISRRIVKKISTQTGVRITHDLGRYLGTPLLQNRVYKDMFSGLLDKVQGKLAGWKKKCLSYAARVTLIEKVLSALPTYMMQTVAIPTSVLDELEKYTRNFLWNVTKDRRGMHHIGGGIVTQARGKGGLGIRRLKEMNKDTCKIQLEVP